MTAVAEQPVSLRAIVEEMYEPGKPTHELAQAIYEVASDEENRKAALEGWADAILRHERRLWERPSQPEVRSGHHNASGRYSRSARPDQGIFARYVRTNDGEAHSLGELTIALCGRLKDEYRARELSETAGRTFFAKLEKALKKAGKATVAELGAERVEAIREETGYRE